MGTRNHVLDGFEIPYTGGGNFGGLSDPLKSIKESVMRCMQQKDSNGISATTAADGTAAAGSNTPHWTVSHHICSA